MDVVPQSISVDLADPEGVTSGTLVVAELPRRTTLVPRVDSRRRFVKALPTATRSLAWKDHWLSSPRSCSTPTMMQDTRGAYVRHCQSADLPSPFARRTAR